MFVPLIRIEPKNMFVPPISNQNGLFWDSLPSRGHTLRIVHTTISVHSCPGIVHTIVSVHL